MIADLVAVGGDAADDLRVAADELARQEDRRADAAGGKGVEDLDRAVIRGAGVEGDQDLAAVGGTARQVRRARPRERSDRGCG